MELKTAFSWCFFIIAVASDDPKVCIDDGCLLGIREKSRSGREYFSFLGVPYAKPPLGKLRFEPPVKPDPWDVIQAKNDAPTCVIADFNRRENDPPSSEDCLYLNVFTHQIPAEGTSGKALPVMVFLHPGGWMFWAGTRDFFGGNYLLDRDVVLVTMNYRLNVLGFLSTEDDVAPGNWGLKDQNHAMRWVRDNIAAFGGDPDSVTIFGDSAGGASAQFHILSPLSKGYFHRAISQSGLALAPWALATPGDPRRRAEYLGRYFDCPNDNSSVLVQCLREIPAEELVAANEDYYVTPSIEPDHEGAFLIGRPRDLLENEQFSDVPFMTGATVTEADLFKEYLDLVQITEDQNTILTKLLRYDDRSDADVREMIAKIKKFYFNDGKDSQKERAGIRDMLSDRMFIYPLVQTLELHRGHQRSPIFAYSFEFEAPVTFATHFGLQLDENERYNGTCHCDDLMYLFPTEKTFHKGYVHDEEGNAMTERMLDLWTNFAIHGNPTPKGYDITWSPVKSSGNEYLRIGGPKDLRMSSNLQQERIAFWKDLDSEGRGTSNSRDEL